MLLAQINEFDIHVVEVLIAVVMLGLAMFQIFQVIWIRSLDRQQKLTDENIDMKIRARSGELIIGVAALTKQVEKIDSMCTALAEKANTLAITQARIDEQMKSLETMFRFFNK